MVLVFEMKRFFKKGPVFDDVTGMDETLVPLDFQTEGMISDDEIHEIVVAPLAAGVKLTAITDCCHSGSILDLPYSFVENVKVNNREAIAAHAMCRGMAFAVAEAKSDVPIAAPQKGPQPDVQGHMEANAVLPEAFLIRCLIYF